MSLLRRIAAGLLPALLLGQPAAAQLLDPLFTSPTGLYAPGTIYAMGPQQADDKRVVAGSFIRVNGTTLAGLVRLDAAGAIDQAFTQNVGAASNIYRIRAYTAGQYLLGSYGGLLAAGGISRVELLRLNASGTADASFDVGSGPSGGYEYVNEFAVQPDGKVVVTGSFDTFSGTAAAGVARLNANGSLDASFTVGTGLNANAPDYSEGTAVAVQADGKILVGGYFTSFGGQPTNGLVRLNTNGALDTSFSPALPAGAYIEGIVVQPDGKMLLNGSIMINGTTLGLVRLLPTGALDPSFSTNIPGGVSAGGFGQAVVLQPNGKIIASGYFTAANGQTNVTRLNPNGTTDASFQAPSSSVTLNTPYALGVQANGSVLLGGSYYISPSTETSLLRLSSTGTPDPGFAPRIQVLGSVAAMVRQADGNLVIGGNFTEISGQPAHRLARLTATGTLDASYTAATGLLPSLVSALALQPDGKALVGTSRGLLRFATTGSPDPTFAFSPLNIAALAVQTDGKILVTGSFSGSVNGVAYERILRLTSTGTFDPTFARNTLASSPTGLLTYADAVLVQPDGRIVVGGNFRTNTTPYTARVARYETTGALDLTFTSPAFTAANGTTTNLTRIYSLALQPDGKILAGGSFGSVGSTSQYGVARLATTGSLDATFVAGTPLTGAGTVYSLALQPNGRVLLGGAFNTISAAGSLNNIARVLDSGQSDVSFGPSTNPVGTVRSVLVQPDGTIMLAGSFSSVGGQPALAVARIIAANVLAVAAPSAVAERTAAWPVPAHDQLHLALDLSAHPLTVELVDALGRPVRRQPATSATEQTLNLEQLPVGIYLLRVHYAAGTVTRRIAVQ